MESTLNDGLPGCFGEEFGIVVAGANVIEFDQTIGDELPYKVQVDVHVLCVEAVLRHFAPSKIDQAAVINTNTNILWDVPKINFRQKAGHPG
jgi:hypothetical protein